MRVHRQYLDVLTMLKSAVPSPCAGERLEGHERVDAGAGDGPRVGGGAAGTACGGRSRCESHDINDPQQCTIYTGACCWRRPRRVSSLKDVRVATHVERTLQLSASVCCMAHLYEKTKWMSLVLDAVMYALVPRAGAVCQHVAVGAPHQQPQAQHRGRVAAALAPQGRAAHADR